MMKYKPEQYLNCGFYNVTEDEKYYTSKIVKVRKDTACTWSDNTIPKGEYAFYEKCMYEGLWVTSYTSLSVLDKWIEEHEPV